MHSQQTHGADAVAVVVVVQEHFAVAEEEAPVAEVAVEEALVVEVAVVGATVVVVVGSRSVVVVVASSSFKVAHHYYRLTLEQIAFISL